MKKRTKILAGIIAAVALTATVVTVISCADKQGDRVASASAFNYSAIGGIGLLTSYAGEGATYSSAQKSGEIERLTAASTNLTDAEKQQLISNLELAKSFTTGEVVQSEIKQSQREDFTYHYTVSANGIGGTAQVYDFYYNSTTAADNDGRPFGEKEEALSGIVVFDSKEYSVIGEKETERDEEELTFLIKVDQQNYVEIEQEIEDGKTEYSYTAYKNGREVFQTSVEYETHRDGRVELQFESEQNGEEYEYTYHFYNEGDQNLVKVKLEEERAAGESEVRAIIQIITEPDGSFTYLFKEN